MAILTVSRTKPMARKKPITGDSTMKYAILLTPAIWTTPHPPFTTPAPMRPPTNAWDELVGSPNHHVRRSQERARGGKQGRGRAGTISGVMVPLRWVGAKLIRKRRAATNWRTGARGPRPGEIRT